MPQNRNPRSPEAVRQRARELRRSPTPEEQLLWQRLRGRQLGVKFRRQVPMGPFIVDFCSFAARLVVEIDGDPHDEDEQAALDSARTEWLEARGYRVLRFRNTQVRRNSEGVIRRIANELPLALQPPKVQ